MVDAVLIVALVLAALALTAIVFQVVRWWERRREHRYQKGPF
jgi:hypothetical protein